MYLVPGTMVPGNQYLVPGMSTAQTENVSGTRGPGIGPLQLLLLNSYDSPEHKNSRYVTVLADMIPGTRYLVL